MAESSRVHAPPRSYHPLFPQLSLQIVSNPVWEGLQFASISIEMTYMGLIAGNFRPFRAGLAETFWSVICHKISASLLQTGRNFVAYNRQKSFGQSGADWPKVSRRGLAESFPRGWWVVPPPTTHHPYNKLAESSWHITDQKFRPFRRGMPASFPRSRPVCRRVAKARLTTREPISIVGVVQCTARGQCNTHKTSTSTSALLPPRQRRSHFRNSIYRQRPVHDVFALHLPSTTALPIYEQPPPT